MLEPYEGRLFPPPAVVCWVAVVAVGRPFGAFERRTFGAGGGGSRRILPGLCCAPLAGPLLGPRAMNRPVISFSMLDVFQNIRPRQNVNVVFEG